MKIVETKKPLLRIKTKLYQLTSKKDSNHLGGCQLEFSRIILSIPILKLSIIGKEKLYFYRLHSSRLDDRSRKIIKTNGKYISQWRKLNRKISSLDLHSDVIMILNSELIKPANKLNALLNNY